MRPIPSLQPRVRAATTTSLMAALLLAAAVQLPVPTTAGHRGHHLDDQVVIAFHVTIPMTIDAEVGQYAGIVIERDDDLRFVTAKVPPIETEAMIMDFGSRSDVEAAYMNHYVFAQGHVAPYTPDDPLIAQQDHHTLMRTPEAWAMSLQESGALGDKEIKLAIMDTGILDHPDLEPNQLGCPAGGDYGFYGLMGDDNSRGHGTRVAGIAGGVIDNEIGISGIANVCLIDYKVVGGTQGEIVGDQSLDSDLAVGTATGLALAIKDATDKDANIISMSLAFKENDLVLERALDHAWDNNVLLVASSGNEDGPCKTTCYPADHPNVLDVAAAIDQSTLYGLSADIAAPGHQIFSTTVDQSYDAWLHGAKTSWAAPMVSGLAALLWSNNGELTNAQVSCILTATAASMNHPDRAEKLVDAHDAMASVKAPPSC